MRVTLTLQLAPERHCILAAFGHSRFQMGDEWVEDTAAWPAHGPLGEAVGVGVLTHCRPRQTGGATNGEQGLAGQVAPAHVLVGSMPTGAAVGTGGHLSAAAAKGLGALARTAPVAFR